MPSTAWSIGASSKTMFAAFPPSSSVALFRVPAMVRAMALPTSVEPVKASLSTSVLDQRLPGRARAGDDVHDPRWQVGLLAHLGEEQRGQRGRLGRLEDDRVAAAQGRGDLPGEHEQREVPGDDLPHHAQRPRRHARSTGQARMLQFVGPPRVVEEVRRRQRDVHVTRLLDRLAVVDRLQDGELARPLLHDPGDPEEVLAPVGPRHPTPHPPVCRAGGPDGPLDVRGACLGDVGEDLLGRRVDRLEAVATGGLDELAADEEPVRGADVDDGPRLRCRGVEELGHGGAEPSLSRSSRSRGPSRHPWPASAAAAAGR